MGTRPKTSPVFEIACTPAMRCTRRGRDEGASERRTLGARPWWTTSTQTVQRRPTDPRARAEHSSVTDSVGSG